MRRNYALVGVGIVLLFGALIWGYWLPWSGFDGYTLPERSEHIKTLWDWMGLLIVPAVLLAGGVVLDSRERERDRTESEQRTFIDKLETRRRAKEAEVKAQVQLRIERERADDAGRESILQHYLDRVSEILISGALDVVSPHLIEPLKKNATDRREKVLVILVTRTLQVLSRLGSDYKRRDSVFKFLSDCGLIGGSAAAISFRGADLSGLDLSGVRIVFMDFMRANFTGANLSRAMIRGGNFNQAKFNGANMTGVNLFNAELDNADLEAANLTEAIVTSDQIRRTKNYDKAILPEAIMNELNPTQ